MRKLAKIFNIVFTVIYAVLFITVWVLAITKPSFFNKIALDTNWILLIFLALAVLCVFANSKIENAEKRKDFASIGIIQIILGNPVSGILTLCSMPPKE